MLLDDQFIKKLDGLYIRTESFIRGQGGGSRRSREKGSSIEFSDFREYVPGDDFRHIDWNAYARLGRLYIKLFMEEEKAPFTMFLDCSKSMDYGINNKGYFAKRLCAALTYMALKNLDTVSIVGLNGDINTNLNNLSGKQSFLRSSDFIEGLSFYGDTKLYASISSYPYIKSGGGVSILFTDLFSQDDYSQALKYLKYKKQQVILIHILSPEEISPPWQGAITLVDAEDGDAKDITITPRILDRYKKVLDDFINTAHRFCSGMGIYYIPVTSDTNLQNIIFNNLMDKGLVR